MIVSELFIIYLAAAAPFGVSRFLSERARGAGAWAALAKASGAALGWPVAALPRLLGRAASRRGGGEKSFEGREREEQRVEQSRRAAVNALRLVEDLLEDSRAPGDGDWRHALYAAREGVERYAGLSLAAAHAEPEARPTAREMELCRIAGRGGDDLLTAGRCVHRRNVTRLVAHRERAGSELVQALAAACALVRGGRPGGFEGQLRAADVERISEALLRALARVAELPAQFGDGATADGLARLLDAGWGRPAREGEGEASCTTQAVPTAFASSPLRTRTSHGG
ncbi:MAG TPA: hypothetical protein VF668_24350 [Pyrinomonadaceae bacterium]|jgi:hypothetical protein